MHLFYALASYLLFLVGLPVLLTHPKLRHGIPFRLGLYRRRLDPGRGTPRIWLHGASAGDLLSLQPMMQELKARVPGCCIIVTTITNSGLAMARKKLGGVADVVLHAPYDLPGATRRAVATLCPDLLVLEYTEIWPNLIRAAHKGGVRIALTNGRFNPQKLSRYRAFFGAIGNPLRRIDCFLMRSDEEAERVLALGAAPDRVWVTGNTKFDALVLDSGDGREQALRVEMGLGAGPVLIAGSTHEGEEELLLPVYSRLLAAHPGLQLVIAPRYLERSGRIVSLASAAGLSVRLRSGGATAGQAQVTVLDTIGELAAAYRLATLVFVGGSFVRRGGQNVLEPAAQGRPVLFGPHMENFKDSVQVLQGRGGIQVATPDQLFRVADELLSRPDQLEELGQLARGSVTASRGASARNVDHLLAILPRGKVAA
ncbi:MAG TPA: 3-deoxy-D-manno-octulosonic acid transferase [Anaeromyxobacter sp.]|nr:3-deoxy-D-manno-octulosonic acid transferase [Anaeromyxobacter sp.]